MEEVREIYNTISEYVLNPDFFTDLLKVGTGILVVGSAYCLYGIGKIMVETNKTLKDLEEKLK